MNNEMTDVCILHPVDIVGILIVVHNRKDDLFRLLRSLQKQAYSDCEILIIDNCSIEDHF
jgi:glycosyltransferase involved in cell wall biosynthesis